MKNLMILGAEQPFNDISSTILALSEEKAESDISTYFEGNIETIRAWGMSLTSMRDIHRLLSRAEKAPDMRILLAHPSGPGRTWIEPWNRGDGAKRRNEAIKDACDDYADLGAKVRLMGIDDLPISVGAIVNDEVMLISSYRYENTDKRPYSLVSQLSRERTSVVVRDSSVIKEKGIPSFDEIFEKSLPPGHPAAFFKPLLGSAG